MENRIKELVKELNNASEAYYNGQDELMTNYEWDAKFDQLKKLEEETGIILPDSPTQKVSADDTKGKKENHEFSALSFAKTKSVDELINWAEVKPVNLSWKLDGLTLVATYDNGKLSKVLTRGNGITGTNITHKAMAISGIPAEILFQGHLVVRGEALISYDDFERINADLYEDEKYANPRNLASGTLNLDDLEEIKKRNVQFVVFTPVCISDKEITSWQERMLYLRELGFNTVDSVLCENADLLKSGIDKFTELVSDFKYPVDGLVICYDDWAYSQTGSVTGHHATRAGFAFKWKDESVSTTVTDIIYETSRTGIISQVAVFEPVEIAGTTVTKALIPNMNYRADLDIKIGDEIEVIKANLIIPQIVKNHNAEDRKVKVINDMVRYNYPSKCPCCGGTVGIHESESGTMNLICTNPDCNMKLAKKIAHFADRNCMNIMGLSLKKIEFLLQNNYIKSIADLYKLKRTDGYVLNLDNSRNLESEEGWDKKSVTKLLDAIEKSKDCDFVTFMDAIGVPNIGKGQAKLLKNHMLEIMPEFKSDLVRMSEDGDLIGFLYLLRERFYDFSKINGFGEVLSNSLNKWIDDMLIAPLMVEDSDPSVLDVLEHLRFHDEIKSKEKESLITGKTFVVTGEVNHFKNRTELQVKIEELGGKVTGSVSKKTDYLINNDISSTSGKNKKAKELNIPIISEEDFLKMIGE